MTRRIPLWAAVLPLAAGVTAYWLFWQSESDAFRLQVRQAISGVATPEMGGFPYRIEARLPTISLRLEDSGWFASLNAQSAVVNRQPWRTGHVVIAAKAPRLQLTLPDIAGARLDIEAPAGIASVRRSGDHLERLSMHFETAKVWLPVAGGPFEASDFELHLRETPTRAADSGSPTHPVQAEAKLLGLFRTNAGTEFRVEVPAGITAASRLASVDGWRAGGTAEINGGVLQAADGTAVAGFDATLAPLPDGRLAIAGTIDTDCPATVRALIEGGDAGREYRLRRAQRMAISGFSGGGITLGEPQGASGGPVRSQEPPCPVLRR